MEEDKWIKFWRAGLTKKEDEPKKVEIIVSNHLIKLCGYCKRDLLLESGFSNLGDLGFFHTKCIPSFISEKRSGGNRFSILFVDHLQRAHDLWKRLAEAKEVWPDLEPRIDYKDPDKAYGVLSSGVYNDFIFLDAVNAERDLSKLVELILQKVGRAKPRYVVFYGRYFHNELKLIDSWVVLMEKHGIPARVLPISEVVFSKLKERFISEKDVQLLIDGKKEKGDIEDALTS